MVFSNSNPKKIISMADWLRISIENGPKPIEFNHKYVPGAMADWLRIDFRTWYPYHVWEFNKLLWMADWLRISIANGGYMWLKMCIQKFKINNINVTTYHCEMRSWRAWLCLLKIDQYSLRQPIFKASPSYWRKRRIRDDVSQPREDVVRIARRPPVNKKWQDSYMQVSRN